jgi:hypothetical protein
MEVPICKSLEIELYQSYDSADFISRRLPCPQQWKTSKIPTFYPTSIQHWKAQKGRTFLTNSASTTLSISSKSLSIINNSLRAIGEAPFSVGAGWNRWIQGHLELWNSGILH